MSTINFMSRRDELYHYGVKGMRWGVTKLDNRDGDLYLRKGTIVKRVSTDPSDRSWGNRKYVSINQEDHSKWDDYLGRLYLGRGERLTTTHSYKTVKDLKVMSSTKQGELFAKMLGNSNFYKQAVKDLNKYYELMPQMKMTDNPSEEISRLISAASLKTGRTFIDRVLADGYDAVVDTHGQNVAKTPVIVLKPDTNLKEIGVEYTETAKEYLKEVYGIAA